MGSIFDVTIAVATYGSEEWRERGDTHAMPSAREQAKAVHIHLPNGTLAQARNQALSVVRTEWVVFLDGDDSLEENYVKAMASGTADVRAPSLCRVRSGRGRAALPTVWKHRHECTAECLTQGNWVCIGAAARTQLIRDVGGFEEWPVYEDWQLWLKCHLAGATFEPIREAIYRGQVREGSRNHALPPQECYEWHQKIVEATC